MQRFVKKQRNNSCNGELKDSKVDGSKYNYKYQHVKEKD